MNVGIWLIIAIIVGAVVELTLWVTLDKPRKDRDDEI